MTRLETLRFIKEKIHKDDKKANPQNHSLIEDSYSKQAIMWMCAFCAEHYEWKKKLEYDARTNRYYKIKSGVVKV